MSTSIRVTAAARWLVGATATLSVVLVVLVVMPLSASPASARETLPVASAPTPWYTEPLGSLGGRTLAQYVADHLTLVLGPVRG